MSNTCIVSLFLSGLCAIGQGLLDWIVRLDRLAFVLDLRFALSRMRSTVDLLDELFECDVTTTDPIEQL
jgi:hypothetical protein